MTVRLPPILAFFLGATLFGGLILGADRLLPGVAPLAANVLMKAVLLALCLGLMAWDRRALADFGFRRPRTPQRWRRIVGIGALLGMLATAAILLSPAQGMKILEGAGLGQIVLGVWLWSSLTEEVFTRGLIQTWTRKGNESPEEAPAGGGRWSAPVLTGALLFGAMHLTLLARGTDLWTVAILVTVTTALGLAAGRFREQSGSLLPAFVIHLSFNVGGFLAAVVLTIATKLAS